MSNAPSEKELSEYKEAFSLFDNDGDGHITAEELGKAMRSLGQNPTETELQDMINEVDVDGTGTIDLQEFVTMMKMDVGEPDKEAELAQIFRIFDKDNSGSISASELRDAMRAIGQNYTDEEFEEMMDEVDLDRNGTIDFKEFLQLMDHK